MIEEGKLVLRALEPADIDLLYQWENDMELWQVSNTLVPFSRYQIKKYIEAASLDIYQTKQLRLMIESVTPEKNIIGMIDLFDFDPYHNRAGVGIMIHQKFRRHGYAFHAIKLFISYCHHQLGLHQLYCNITSNNQPSIRLFEKSGFRQVGIKKEWVKTNEGYKDEIMYQMIIQSG